MSGESSGLLVVPMLAMLYPPLGIAMVGGAIAYSVGSSIAAANRAERRRRERESIRQAREDQRRQNVEARRREAEAAAMNSRNYEAQQREAEYRAQQREAEYRAQQREAEYRAQQQEAERRAQQQREAAYRAQQMDMVSNSIGSFRDSVARNMNEQVALNRQASEQMMRELEISRNEMLNSINIDDPQKYQDYIAELGRTKGELNKKLVKIEDGFVKNYQTKINESMDSITKEINTVYASKLDELNKMQADIQAKNEMASEIATDYIEEAKVLLTALNEDYNGQRYSKLQMTEIEKAINDAVAQYNLGNYEAAIAVAKDSALVAIEEIYKADCRQQEWENYYKLAVTVASETEAFIKAQGTITAEAKAQVEEKLGKQIEDDVIGVSISDYTEKRADGQNQYDYLLGQVQNIVKLLESEEADKLSTEQLKAYIDMINTKVYPAASQTIFKAILNMSNAFSRQNISEEIIDFFEEHNFNFTGFSYDEEKHDGALHIGLENDVTGEEIIVTLSPELMSNGDVQTRVEIDQLKGDETNEARKEFYRTSVQECVAESTPGAQVKLECRKETKNKLSDKTGLRDQLK